MQRPSSSARRALSLAPLALAALAGESQERPAERLVELIDNPRFTEPPHPEHGGIPWWRTAAGAPALDRAGGLRTRPGDVVEQPLAVFAPYAGDLVVSGEVRGKGRVELAGDDGRAGCVWEVGDGPFTLALAAPACAELPRPRFLLRLSSPAGPARWLRATASAPLPAPEPGELREEVLVQVDDVHRKWLARALDDVGERSTAFVAFDLDAETGERGPPFKRVSLHPLYVQLLEVWSLEGGAWREAALAAYLDDLFELGTHPATGLPRHWHPAIDRPDDERAVEIALALRFLVDCAERGPEELRARAREAARHMGETVLARGVRPDGSVAATYRPRDGEPAAVVTPLRQLDVPAQLARLGALVGDERFARAAREAVLTLEYTHYWPLAWGKIDPGFDDNFGHLGGRAVTMWKAWPAEPSFRRLALSGFERYAPALDDLVRFGGYVAADQVRCWRIFADVGALEPRRAPAIGTLLLRAARHHFKGQQGEAGYWIDVTMQGFDPVSNLPVGDLGGLPQNLLEGLALFARPDVVLGDAERADARAMYAAVWRSSREVYAGAFGLRVGARAGEGFVSGEGSLRLAAGGVAFLRALNGRTGR